MSELQRVQLNVQTPDKNIVLLVHEAGVVAQIVAGLTGAGPLGNALGEIFNLAEIAVGTYANTDVVDITPDNVLTLLAKDVPLVPPVDAPAAAQKILDQAKATANAIVSDAQAQAAQHLDNAKAQAQQQLDDAQQQATKIVSDAQATASQTSATSTPEPAPDPTPAPSPTPGPADPPATS